MRPPASEIDPLRLGVLISTRAAVSAPVLVVEGVAVGAVEVEPAASADGKATLPSGCVTAVSSGGAGSGGGKIVHHTKSTAVHSTIAKRRFLFCSSILHQGVA